jgi:hypothetical protein
MKNSKLYSLPNLFEWFKGLFMAIGTPLIYLLQDILPSLGLTQWQQVALSALIAYLLKTVITGEKGNFFSNKYIGGGGYYNPK